MATALLLPPEPSSPGPFHLSEAWARCWADAFGEGRPYCIELDCARLRMELRQEQLWPMRFALLASATNLQTSYFDVEGEAPPAALARLPQRLIDTGAAQVRIDWLDAQSPLLAAAEAWRGRYALCIEPFAVSPLADCRAEFDDFLARTGSSVGKYWKACRRHILRGTIQFSVVRGGSDLGSLLDEMFALEASGWKGREGTAILCNPADARFYRSLALAAAEAGALRIALLREEGRLLAYELCVVGGDSVLAMKVGYDESQSKLQPGHLVALMNIRDACADPAIAWYDMLGNGMRVAPYKQRFATEYRTLYRIRLFSGSATGRLLYALYRAKPYAKRLREGLRSLAGRFKN